MTCDEAVKLFLAYLDQALKGRRLEELEEHLNHCIDCCDHLEFTRRVNTVVGQRLSTEPLPADLARRIEALVRPNPQKE